MIRAERLLSAILVFSMAAVPPASAARVDLRVEGVIAGLASDPEELSAVIDGEIYTAGDTAGDFVVVEVRPESVVVRPAAGGDPVTLEVGYQPPEFVPEPPAEPAGKPWWEALLGDHFPSLNRLRERIRYAGLINELKKVHMSAMVYYLENGSAEVGIAQLVEAGSLPSFMKKPRQDGYVFRILGAKEGVRVLAEPAESPAGKKHFLIDEHGYLYAEEGRRATPESPRFSA